MHTYIDTYMYTALLPTQPSKVEHIGLGAAQVPLVREGPRRRHSCWRGGQKCRHLDAARNHGDERPAGNAEGGST